MVLCRLSINMNLHARFPKCCTRVRTAIAFLFTENNPRCRSACISEQDVTLSYNLNLVLDTQQSGGHKLHFLPKRAMTAQPLVSD
jgi:hypothetical protein